jgi:hypothetical protein
MARNAFHTFIPMTVDSNARKNIIEHSDDGKGFEGGYKSWVTCVLSFPTYT